ncbi:MAG TPA: DUF4232 domain-containing protein [Acidimicrobiales bacterium]|nr:DUF4232 domain-containing protein [Acidimicrobiales bacterium]
MRAAASKWAAGTLSVALGAVALGACSSTPSSTKTTTTTTHTPRTTTSTPTSTSTSTSTIAALTTCQVAGLKIIEVGHGGAAGTQEMTFSLTNTSGTPCGTYGYPGMLLVGSTGAALPTTVVRGGSLSFENIAPAHVTLGPGQTAYFNVGFNDVQTGSTSCSSAHTVEITPPTNTTHATVGDSLGIYACNNGTLNVSAVFPATNTSATQTTAPS